ncbi:MAG TPA: FAD-dependent oxidoreductase, partial [Limnochordia bacterium]
MERVVVLGGGFGGLRAAQRLARRTKRDDMEIVLIDRSAYHTLRPKLPQAIGGRIACAVHLPFTEVLAGTGIRFIQADITAIDPDRRRVAWKDGELEADALIVALGGEAAPGASVTGAAEHALPVWSFDQACAIRRRIAFMAELERRGRAVNNHVVIIGGGFVGTEIAAEVRLRLRRLGSRGTTTLIEQADRLLPRLSERAGKTVERRLAELGVRVLTGVKVASVEAEGVMLSDGRRLPAATVIWAGGVRGAGLLAKCGLTDATGRVPVLPTLESIVYPGIWAIGDCAYVVGRPASAAEPSAHRAEREAKTAAANVAAYLRGQPQRIHPEEANKYLLGLGPGYGVLEAPPLPILAGRIAAWLKEFVMIRHVFSLGGWRLVRAVSLPL